MTNPQSVLDSFSRQSPAGRISWMEEGASLAESFPPAKIGARPSVRLAVARRILERAADSDDRHAESVLGSARLLQAAEKAAGDLARSGFDLPVVAASSGAPVLRISRIASAWLDRAASTFDEEAFIAFLDGFQQHSPLTMREIACLPQALQAELMSRLERAARELWPVLICSLREIAETLWEEILDSIDPVEQLLRRDPAGVYSQMDAESRARYRDVVARLARHGVRSEWQIAETALTLAQEASESPDPRRAHVGFYLIGKGSGSLEQRAGYCPPRSVRLVNAILRRATPVYLLGLAVLTCALAALMLSGAHTPLLMALALLLIPASQAAVDLVNGSLSFLLPPRVLPRLDFSEGIPDSCATMVAVPALLIDEQQVRRLIRDLEIRYLANRDPNLSFALLTDLPDSRGGLDGRAPLVSLCHELIENLNWRYPASPFLLLHRRAIYNGAENCWMGWERKRGKLLDLNRLLRGAGDEFPVKAGTISALRRIRYVITLDSDTQLPRGAAAKLVGAIAHPLNQAIVDPATRTVTEGYGILQPRVSISIASSLRSRLAAYYSGDTGFDIYTCAVSDAYQDLFGEGIFTGKGIYDVDVMRQVLDSRFPDNSLLSHDLIEGCYARTALVSDIELVDDYPSNVSAYQRRKHRWTRGDWQLLPWLWPGVPSGQCGRESNPLSLISKWKIVDNLRRSLLAPSLLLMLLTGWVAFPADAYFWTGSAVVMLFIPAWWNLLFSAVRAPGRRHALAPWAAERLRQLRRDHVLALFSVVFLLYQALLSMDATARTLVRLSLTRRGLLEWETAAESETAARRRSAVDGYLKWVAPFSAALGLLLAIVRPGVLPAAAPILALWMGSRVFAVWLDGPTLSHEQALSGQDVHWLRGHAQRIYRYFSDWSSEGTNWLIPDSVDSDGKAELRLSPTNLGMLLNARIAGVHLGMSSIEEFVDATRETLSTVEDLPKYRGHLFNWYNIESLQPMPPRFVSTVDSGNLAASLWTLKQAALEFAAEPAHDHVRADLSDIAVLCDRLVLEMDFSFLYNPRRHALSIGYDAGRKLLEPSCYDLLASEARIAVFIAIAKGDIPLRCWSKLGRGHIRANGRRALASWTGSMFEYLMPRLWMKHYPATMTGQSARAAVSIQRNHTGSRVPWGVSESAHCETRGKIEYGPFGVAALALNPAAGGKLVIAPYATALAAQVDPAASVRNLRWMEKLGWSGRYGSYEAIDHSHGSRRIIRAWMAHHQGMSLLAICNVLFDDIMQRYFHAEPHVAATELLLHERMAAGATSEPDLVLGPGEGSLGCRRQKSSRKGKGSPPPPFC